MKKILLLGLLVFIGGTIVSAQQSAHYTQFMYNKLKLNPGYAGSSEVPCISCIHRNQWAGLEGAPATSVLNFHMPFFTQKVGAGVSVSRDRIGPQESWDFSMMYSYRIKLPKGNLSLGLGGSLRRYVLHVPELRATSPSDDLLQSDNLSLVKPNFSGGIYYESKKWFAGFSVQDLVSNDLEFGLRKDQFTSIGSESSTMYLMSGLILDLNSKIKAKPSFLLKYTQNTPIDLDVNGSLIFFNKLWLGATYRMGGFKNSAGESIDLILQYQLSPKLRFGVAYDFPFGMIADYTSGTFEALLQYCFVKSTEGVTNPRFF